jgi:hypothetical protein
MHDLGNIEAFRETANARRTSVTLQTGFCGTLLAWPSSRTDDVRARRADAGNGG